MADIRHDYCTDAIKETQVYKDYEAKYGGRKGKQATGESSSPRLSLKIRIRQQKSTSTTPLPPSDDQERDDIIEATQLGLVVEKLEEGNDESDGNDFADTVLLSDEYSVDRLEPRSQKENPEIVDDDDDDDDDDEKKDEKHDDANDDDDDNDDRDNHALIKTQRRKRYESHKEIVPNITTSATNDLIKDNLPRLVTDVVKHERESSQRDAKFEKSSASVGSCRDDAFRKRDHDDHQGDDAPPKGGEKCKKAKDIKKLKASTNYNWMSERKEATIKDIPKKSSQFSKDAENMPTI
ncbi:hypothetical protein Tco_1368010 [Tanacetum coccineum]|uniref:Uncharacterized protein n=1 Tax=Tanacetum coccineum TaxID=301880 RepID=A0ABQ5I4D0_9ASTR